MTKLTTGKQVSRETAAAHRGRPIMVTVGPQVFTFRLKGKRARFTLSIAGAFEYAVKIEAYQRAKEAKARRAERRALRAKGAL